MENKLYNLKSLKKIAGDNQEFIEKMIDLFCSITPSHVTQLKKNWEEKNFKKVGEIAHGMKPSIDQMGIYTLHETIRKVEKVGKEAFDQQEIEKEINKLSNTIDQVVNQLKSA